jgi:hypothetical protein
VLDRTSSGSRCPDDLGDLLTEAGVFVGLLFASYVLLKTPSVCHSLAPLILTPHTVQKSHRYFHLSTAHRMTKLRTAYTPLHMSCPT